MTRKRPLSRGHSQLNINLCSRASRQSTSKISDLTKPMAQMTSPTQTAICTTDNHRHQANTSAWQTRPKPQTTMPDYTPATKRQRALTCNRKTIIINKTSNNITSTSSKTWTWDSQLPRPRTAQCQPGRPGTMIFTTHNLNTTWTPPTLHRIQTVWWKLNQCLRVSILKATSSHWETIKTVSWTLLRRSMVLSCNRGIQTLHRASWRRKAASTACTSMAIPPRLRWALELGQLPIYPIE